MMPREFWPAISFRTTVRAKLLIVGSLLMILSVGSMAYLFTRVVNIANFHRVSTSQLNLLIRVHGVTRAISDIDTEIRAFAATGDKKWLVRARETDRRISAALDEVRALSQNVPHAQRLVEAATDNHRLWHTRIAEPVLSGKLRIPPQLALREPHILAFNTSIQTLELAIGNESISADRNVLKTAHRTENLIIITACVFFVFLAAFVAMLWNSVIPGLEALLTATREMKAGNLNYQIQSKILKNRDEIGTLGRTFNEMASSLKEQTEKMRELNRLKTDFVSTVSHELRTPLTAIKGGLGLVLGGVTGPLSEESRDLLSITARNTDRLIRLINDVLDVSKIEAGALKLCLDKHSVAEIIDHALKSIETYAATHNITLSWDRPTQAPLVVVDRDRFEQVLTNLLSNAIKFSPEGSAVKVEVTNEKDHVRVKVSDRGTGISLEQQNKLFRKFQQIGQVNHKNSEGTGLGLYIAKSLVEEHGGRIWVESIEGEGSDFYFTIPWNGVDFEAASAAA